MQFNHEQQQLIDAPFNQKVIGIAGAGTGKTTTILERTRQILEAFPTGKILLITFTRAAARDISMRLNNVVTEEQSRRVISGTFHSIMGKLIRDNASAVGLRSNFSIIDETSMRVLYRGIVEENEDYMKLLAELSGEEKPTAKVMRMVPNAISALVNTAKPEELKTGNYSLETIWQFHKCHTIFIDEMVNGQPTKLLKDFLKMCHECFIKSLSVAKETNVLTYDQILFIAYLMSESKMLEGFKSTLCHTIVDEYQDTNALQDVFIRYVSDGKLTLIGDIDQSLYEFRGGKPDLLYQHAREGMVINLSTNYRSYQPILDIANDAIKQNGIGKEIRKPLKTPKPLDTEYGGILLTHSQSETSEADFVIEKIKFLQSKKVPDKEIAILIRSRLAYLVLNKQLAKSGIKINDTTNFADFMKSDVVTDLLNFIKIYINPQDIFAFLGVIDRPKRGIGPKAIQTLQDNAKDHGLTLIEYVLSDHVKELKKGLYNKVMEFTQVYRDILTDKSLTFERVIHRIIHETGYHDWIINLANGATHAENIKIFKDMAIEFEKEYKKEHKNYTLFDILSEFVFDMANNIRQDDAEGVTVTTIHGAKGLEWDHVFIVGLEQGVFPGLMYDDRDLQSERRLLYVALTRAKKSLTLCYCEHRVGLNNIEGNKTLQKSSLIKYLNLNNVKYIY